MLALTVACADSVLPALSDLSEPDLEVWRDNDGMVCAYGYIRDDQHWMILPGLASFQFSRDVDNVAVTTAPDTRLELILDAFHRSVLPMVLQVHGRAVLHASAVRMDGGVVALCAISETGKSTIAYGLSRRGHQLWADDAVAVDVADPDITAMPLPFSIRLRPASASYFARELPGHAPLDQIVDTQVSAELVPLAALCVLKRLSGETADPPVQIRRMSSREAFPAVLAHAYCFSLRDIERKRHMLQQYLDLVSRVPVLEVSFQTGLDVLPAVLDGIEHAVTNMVARPH